MAMFLSYSALICTLVNRNQEYFKILRSRLCANVGKLLKKCFSFSLYRPYSEQRHDRYESEAVRDRLTVFPMASAVKS